MELPNPLAAFLHRQYLREQERVAGLQRPEPGPLHYTTGERVRRRYPEGGHVYHYTVGRAIGRILEAGYIDLSGQWYQRSGLPRPLAVYASTEPFWEPATLGGGNRTRLCVQGLARVYNGLFRIEVKPEAMPLSWEDYKGLQELSLYRPFERTYLPGIGSDPSRWRISLEPVREVDWLGVDVLRCRRFTVTSGHLGSWGPNEEPEWFRLKDPRAELAEAAAEWHKVVGFPIETLWRSHAEAGGVEKSAAGRPPACGRATE